MSEPKLTDALEHWLQGRINTCVSGLMSRLNHLETQAGTFRKESRDCIDELMLRADELEGRAGNLDSQAAGQGRLLEVHGRRIRNLEGETVTPEPSIPAKALEQIDNAIKALDSASAFWGGPGGDQFMSAMVGLVKLRDPLQSLMEARIDLKIHNTAVGGFEAA